MDKIVKVLKKIKLRNIIVLMLLLIFNTYAWFVYNTRISMDLSVHVSSWEIRFENEDNQISNYMYVAVERAYPGMQQFEKEVTVRNGGEISAQLDYEIESLFIMGDSYDTTDEESDLTSEDLEDQLDEYPFKINIYKDDTHLNSANGGTGLFRVTVDWPYESGDDELDTYWGNRAYEYYSLHPGTNCILIKLKLIAKQSSV